MDPVGKLVMTVIGAVNLGVGIYASTLGAAGASIASNILGPLPSLGQFLRITSLQTASYDVTLAIKIVIDLFAGGGNAIALAAGMEGVTQP
jgi:hypothetical protein